MKHFLLALFIVTGFTSLAQNVRFKMQYQTGGQQPITGEGLHQMPDSGFIFCSDDGMSLNATVLNRTNKWGEVIWSKRFQHSFPGIHQLIRFSDNRYAIFTGREITRIDSVGNVIWNIELDTVFWYAAAAKNDALILQGLRDHPATEKMMSVAKIDSTGMLVWSTSVDSLVTNGIDDLTVVPLADGSEVYVMLGTCYNEYNNYEVVTCISESGILLWNHLFPYTLNTIRICTTNDSCALLSGYARFDSLGNTGIYLLKLKTDGSVVHSKVIGPINFSLPSITVDPEKILLTGNMSWLQQGRIFSICVDTGFTFIWQKEIFGSSPNILYGCGDTPVLCSDGGYATLALRQTIPNTPYDLCIVKGDNTGSALCSESNTNYSVVDITCTWITDSIQYPFPVIAQNMPATPTVFDVNHLAICTSVDVQENTTENKVVLVPNPSTDFVQVQLQNPSAQLNEVIIYNIMGDQIACFVTYENDFRVETSELAPGTYTLSVNGEFCSGKIVVVH